MNLVKDRFSHIEARSKKITIGDFSLSDQLRGIEKLRVTDRFLIDQPSTPISLIKEITSRIRLQSTSRIAVLFTIEWALYLKSVGFKNITVLTEDYDQLIQNICIVNEFKYILISEAINKNMKFDNVAGNPPFQKSDNPNSHSLWEKFLERSFDLVKKDGYVSLITPYIGRRKVQKFFHDNDVISYRGIGVDNYFNVGSTFCWYVIRSGKQNVKTEIITDAGTHLIEFPNLGFIPNDITKDNLEFLTRMTTGTKLAVRTDCGIHSTNKEKFSNKPSAKFKYVTQHTSAQTKYCSEAPKSLTMKKVICSKSGYLKPWYDDGTTGVTEGSWIVEVSSKKQANQVIEFLNSADVKRFVRLISSNTSANDPSLFKLLAFKFK